jgi:hypothetical protein
LAATPPTAPKITMNSILSMHQPPFEKFVAGGNRRQR